MLIVEDQFLIGAVLADDLEELGFQTAGPFMSCADALKWLETGSPDLAILDVRLRGENCTEVAHELRRRAVPFLFLTGDPDWSALHDEFAGVPVLTKPVQFPEIRAALQRLSSSISEAC